MPERQEHVFISYAREDAAKARAINQYLHSLGVQTWLDAERLVPGQIWKHEIFNAIRTARGVLFVSSIHSINKAGFVQHELKEILEQLSEMPTGDVFMIVVRLDDTEPRDLELRDRHWVNMFPSWSDGLGPLQQAIFKNMEHAARRYAIEMAERAKDKSAQSETTHETEQEAVMEASADVLFRPEELDIYCNKVTREAYIFHRKEIDYSAIDYLVYDGDDQTVQVVWTDGSKIDLGVKIQWLVRPYIERADEILIVRTREGESIDGAMFLLKKKGNLRFTGRRMRSSPPPPRRPNWFWALLDRFKSLE